MRRGSRDGGLGALLPFIAALGSACATQAPPATIPAVVVPPSAPVVRAPPAAAPFPVAGTIQGGAGLLQYHIVGSGADTVLVPLASWLQASLAPLGARHTLVFYDPRHRGRSHALSDSLAATFEGDVADLEAVRAAIGVARVAVIGYDYYAAVAAAWAATHPQSVTRLVLVSPIEPADSLSRSWNPPGRMARIDTTAARALVKARAAGRDTADVVKYCEEFWQVNARLLVGDTARAKDVRADWCQLPNETPARIAAAAQGALASLGPATDFGARARVVSVPTLVMQGRLDLVANPEGAREWARRIPGARLLWLGNVGHLPHLEDPTVVREAINDFLAGGWPPRAGPP